jgi:hypothetical protein
VRRRGIGAVGSPTVGLGGFIRNTVLGKGADDYGSVPVPGSGTFDLPAGKVRLTYQESKKSRAFGGTPTSDIEFAAPIGLEVTVAPTSGGPPLAMTGPGFMGMGTNKSTRRGQSRDEIGSVEVPGAGSYTVKVTAPDLPDAVEPQVLLGI